MSDPIVLKKPRVRFDLAGCYAHIGQRNPDAARRFLLAADETFEALACTPGWAPPYATANPRLEGLRCSRVRRFRNYLIFYGPTEGGVEVIRVLHAARDIPSILAEEGD